MARSFKLLQTLGEGAFGEVHLAEVREADDFVQTLAVKWLHARWSADPHLAGRLRDEARLLALLNNEHIVRVHGLTRLDGRLAILMEAIDGVDLSQLGAALPPRVVCEVMAASADALDAAWCTVPVGETEPLRVVHRDIKPSNIMVTARGGVKVMDFGVARATFQAREAETQSQQFGTARYMAPERWLEGVAGAPSDIFSLGVTVLELLAGEAIERPRLARGAFASDIAEALERAADWPELQALIASMVAYEPEDRPTASEVAERAQELAASLPKPGLRAWAAAWVPDHQGGVSVTSADGTIMDEDGSGDAFAATGTATSWATEPVTAQPPEPLPPDRQLGLGPTARGVVIGALLALLVGTGFAIWRAPGPVDEREVGTRPPLTATEDERPATEEPVAAAEPIEEPAQPIAEPIAEEPVREEPAAAEAASPPPVRQPPPAPPSEPVEPVEPDAVGEADDGAAEPVLTTPVTFIADPPDLQLSYGGEALTLRSGRTARLLERGTQQLGVSDGETSWSCTLIVGAASATYKVTADRRCTPTL